MLFVDFPKDGALDKSPDFTALITCFVQVIHFMEILSSTTKENTIESLLTLASN